MNTSITECVNIIQNSAPGFVPQLGIVLGSGLGQLADSLTDTIRISYSDLPGFPQPKVKGHSGELILGKLNGCAVACLSGRSHYYEARHYDEVKVYIRTLRKLGCEYFLATNAAGSLREDVGPGSLMLITDHINFLPGNPLAGPNDDEFGPRFPPLCEAYHSATCDQLRAIAAEFSISLAEGVYIAVSGPSYETAAEIRAFKQWGADAVGMSTVPEVIIANHCGLKVGVISTMTNFATGLSSVSHDHDQVVIMANQAAQQLTRIVSRFAEQLV